MLTVARNFHLRQLSHAFGGANQLISKTWIRCQHEAVVGIRDQRSHPRDEFEIIKEKTKSLFEKPKKHREPFIKNLFLKKIDPTMLEYPEVTQDSMDDLMSQVEPVANKVRTVDASKIDENAVLPEDVLAELRHSGAFVHQIPRTHGGNELNMVGYTAIVEAMSLEGNASLGAWAYTMGSWAARTLEHYGSEEQKAFYLPLMATGQASFALCVSEAKSGTNVAAMETCVRLGPDNRGYIISGKKSWVINAAKCDYFIVIAKHLGLGMDVKFADPETQFTEDKKKTGSMSAFLVPKKAPGVSIGDPHPFVGLRGLQVSELTLNEVALPLDALIGKTGDGFTIAMNAVSLERHVFGCIMIPLLKKLIDEASRYVAERRVFNRPLADFEMIQEKLSEAAYLTYALESMTYLTSLIIDTTIRPEFDMESAAVRAFAADIAPRCIQNIREIFGASGATYDKGFDLALRDVLTLSELDGGTDVARLYISLSGFQYAGIAKALDLQKHNNPFNYPNDGFRRVIKAMGFTPKEGKAYLDDYVHPTLQYFAQQLEKSCAEFGQITDGMLLEYNKDLIRKQVELRKVSDMAVLLYGMFAVLGRCSRAYCVGMKNNKHETNLAALFLIHAAREINGHWRDIGSGEYGKNAFVQEAAKHMVAERSYAVEHPLTRNY